MLFNPIFINSNVSQGAENLFFSKNNKKLNYLFSDIIRNNFVNKWPSKLLNADGGKTVNTVSGNSVTPGLVQNTKSSDFAKGRISLTDLLLIVDKIISKEENKSLPGLTNKDDSPDIENIQLTQVQVSAVLQKLMTYLHKNNFEVNVVNAGAADKTELGKSALGSEDISEKVKLVADLIKTNKLVSLEVIKGDKKLSFNFSLIKSGYSTKESLNKNSESEQVRLNNNKNFSPSVSRVIKDNVKVDGQSIKTTVSNTDENLVNAKAAKPATTKVMKSNTEVKLANDLNKNIDLVSDKKKEVVEIKSTSVQRGKGENLIKFSLKEIQLTKSESFSTGKPGKSINNGNNFRRKIKNFTAEKLSKHIGLEKNKNTKVLGAGQKHASREIKILSKTNLSELNRTEPEVVSETQTKVMSKAGPKVVSKIQPKSVSETLPKVMSAPQRKVMNETQPKAMNETQPKAMNETQPKAMNETQPKAMSETQPKVMNETQPEAVSETQPKAMSETQPKAMSETHPKVMNETQPKVVSETITQLKAKQIKIIFTKEPDEVKSRNSLSKIVSQSELDRYSRNEFIAKIKEIDRSLLIKNNIRNLVQPAESERSSESLRIRISRSVNNINQEISGRTDLGKSVSDINGNVSKEKILTEPYETKSTDTKPQKSMETAGKKSVPEKNSFSDTSNKKFVAERKQFINSLEKENVKGIVKEFKKFIQSIRGNKIRVDVVSENTGQDNTEVLNQNSDVSKNGFSDSANDRKTPDQKIETLKIDSGKLLKELEKVRSSKFIERFSEFLKENEHRHVEVKSGSPKINADAKNEKIKLADTLQTTTNTDKSLDDVNKISKPPTKDIANFKLNKHQLQEFAIESNKVNPKENISVKEENGIIQRSVKPVNQNAASEFSAGDNQNRSEHNSSEDEKIQSKNNNNISVDKTSLAATDKLMPGEEINTASAAKTQTAAAPQEMIENFKIIKAAQVYKELARIFDTKKKQTVMLQLDPKELGKIKVNIDVIKNIVKAHIEVENEQAKQIVQNNLESLKYSLTQGGVQINSLSVSIANYTNKQYKPNLAKKKSNDRNNIDEKNEQEKPVSRKMLGYNTYEYLI